MNGWRATLLVAARETSERLRSRAYLVSTALTLVIVAALIGMIALTDAGETRYSVGLTGANPAGLDRTLAAAADAAGAVVAVDDLQDEAAARAAVDDGTLDGAVIGDDTIIVQRNGDGVQAILEAALTQARFLAALEEAGVDPAALIPVGDIEVVAIAPPRDDADAAVATISIVLLFLVITMYGQWVLMGVLEEKSTRVVEQVVAAISVRSLLAGKVLGIGLLGFAQLALLVVTGLFAGSRIDALALPASAYATAAWSVVWFVLGFAFYAVLYAAAGSLVSRTEDAQTAATPVALLGVASYLGTFGLVLASEPDSLLSRLVSLLPPVAPIAFPARIAAGAVPWWESLLAVAITAGAVVAVVRVAARIYAGALLAQGSRIGLRQAWRAAGELAGH